MPLPKELQLGQDLGAVVRGLSLILHFFLVFPVEDHELVFFDSLNSIYGRDRLLFIFATLEEVARYEGLEKPLTLHVLAMAQVETIDAEDAFLWLILLVELCNVPFLEVGPRHQPIQEVFLLLESLRLNL